MKITVETKVEATIDRVWRAWTTPADIVQWNAASDDWHTTAATVDLRPGGAFSSRMEARDGSAGFEFGGRAMVVEFVPDPGSVTVRETFDVEASKEPPAS